MDHVGSILLMLRPWIGYDYIVIQVVCWVELPKQRRFYPILFLKNMDPDKWDTTVWYHLESTGVPRVDGLSTRPPDLGCHCPS